MYCHKEISDNFKNNIFYCDIQLSEKTVELYGKGKIIKVLVKENRSNEKSDYSGWWDNKDNNFTIVYPKSYFEICFPYGSKGEEERKKYNVIIEELN